MKKKPFLSNVLRLAAYGALLLLLVVTEATTAAAAVVRGRLDRVDQNGRRRPAVGIAVTVYNPTVGRSSAATTGADGMYYIYNVPPGSYYLEVWVSRPPMVFQIYVSEPYTDIAPIVVP